MTEKIASDEKVIFNLGSEKFALSTEQVKSIEEMQDIIPVPLAPPYVTGLINLRGAIVAVVDLRKRIGLSQVENGRDMVILIVEHNGEEVGLIVDRVQSVESSEFTAQPVPESVVQTRSGRFYLSVFGTKDEKTVILNLDKILALEEK
jgi:purine-binding chemotaxis protein CheW